MERRKGDAADSVPERTNARNGFSNELMYGQNTEEKKKRLVLYGRLNDVRRKCGETNWRELGRTESQKLTEGGRGKERGFTQQFFSPASHALRACEARALRACKTLTPRFTDFFTDFEKKTDCFAVYRERNKERKRRKEGAEDRNARYGRRRGLDPLSLSTRNGEN